VANKVSVIIDVVADKAVSGLKGFKQSVADADGAVGKFKAGASSAFDTVKANAGNFAMAAGAAVVAFGVKSVSAFQDAALAAGKFADATGLSTEEASRWVAVADDIGISSEAMEKSFGKLAVSIGKNNPLLEQYGITVQKGADGQDDMNATMLHAVDVIRNIEDPTKKAAVAQAALGKGWMEMAELIQQGSGSLTTSLAAVSEAQVIDPKEVEKARKMRESLDTLQDSVQDLFLVVGEDLVPTVAMFADVLADLIGPLSDVNQWSKDVATSFLELVGVIDGGNKDALKNAPIAFGKLGASLDAATRAGDMHVEMQEGLQQATEDSTEATEQTTKTAIDYNKALDGLNDALEERLDATLALVGGDIAVRDSQRQAAEAVAALTALEKDGKAATDEYAAAQDAAAEELIAAAQAATDYDEDLANANGETLTAAEKQAVFRDKLIQVAQTLAPGSPLLVQLLEYIDLLDNIPETVETNVKVTRTGDLLTPINGRRASGGPVSTGGTYLVGEQGPELLHMAGNGYVSPNGASAGAGYNITVNAGMGADGRRIGDSIVDAIKDFERRNGSAWRR
jgi:hypothetical protein